MLFFFSLSLEKGELDNEMNGMNLRAIDYPTQRRLELTTILLFLFLFLFFEKSESKNSIPSKSCIFRWTAPTATHIRTSP